MSSNNNNLSTDFSGITIVEELNEDVFDYSDIDIEAGLLTPSSSSYDSQISLLFNSPSSSDLNNTTYFNAKL